MLPISMVKCTLEGSMLTVSNQQGSVSKTYCHLVFNMQNCSGGVDQDCINAYEGTGETWKCFMAQV